MPPKSERQRKKMGADLARARAGKTTETGMSEAQLRDFARKPTTGGKTTSRNRSTPSRRASRAKR
jgi:hypothetical protein